MAGQVIATKGLKPDLGSKTDIFLQGLFIAQLGAGTAIEIGRASCRERV